MSVFFLSSALFFLCFFCRRIDGRFIAVFGYTMQHTHRRRQSGNRWLAQRNFVVLTITITSKNKQLYYHFIVQTISQAFFFILSIAHFLAVSFFCFFSSPFVGCSHKGNEKKKLLQIICWHCNNVTTYKTAECKMCVWGERDVISIWRWTSMESKRPED